MTSYWTWKKFRGSWVQCSPPFYFISKSLSVLSFHFVFVCEFTHVVVYMFLCKGRHTHRSYRTLDISPYLTYLLRQVPPSAIRHCICQADFPINFGVSPASSFFLATAALGLQISVTLPDITWVLGIWTQVLTLDPLRHFQLHSPPFIHGESQCDFTGPSGFRWPGYYFVLWLMAEIVLFSHLDFGEMLQTQ